MFIDFEVFNLNFNLRRSGNVLNYTSSFFVPLCSFPTLMNARVDLAILQS